MIVIARFGYRYQAELARGFLDAAGIGSVLAVDDAAGMQVGMAFSNPARLLVTDNDADRARQVLLDAGLLGDDDHDASDDTDDGGAAIAD